MSSWLVIGGIWAIGIVAFLDHLRRMQLNSRRAKWEDKEEDDDDV